MKTLLCALCAFVLLVTSATWAWGDPASPAGESAVLQRARGAACRSALLRALGETGNARICADAVAPSEPATHRAGTPATGSFGPLPIARITSGDGALLGRVRLATIGAVGVDLVAYRSSGLAVTGLFCFVDDGVPRPTVLHLHGGFGGIFVNPDGGDTVGTCYRWASLFGKNAFVPSFRGQDGGQGQPELCLGEADDVAAAALFLRSEAVVDGARIALVGGSMGGCVALRAGTLIPDLRAVVAIAPPTDFKSLVTFHRTAYVPKLEARCDGSTLDWNQGGPVFADTIDRVICGHPVCSDAEYIVRSPILSVQNATNPTLVLTAGDDNLVPMPQQVLWSALRNAVTGKVAVAIPDRCAAAATPTLAQDVLMFVPGGFHLLEVGNISSSLLYLIEKLDAPAPGVSS